MDGKPLTVCVDESCDFSYSVSLSHDPHNVLTDVTTVHFMPVPPPVPPLPPSSPLPDSIDATAELNKPITDHLPRVPITFFRSHMSSPSVHSLSSLHTSSPVSSAEQADAISEGTLSSPRAVSFNGPPVFEKKVSYGPTQIRYYCPSISSDTSSQVSEVLAKPPTSSFSSLAATSTATRRRVSQGPHVSLHCSDSPSSTSLPRPLHPSSTPRAPSSLPPSTTAQAAAAHAARMPLFDFSTGAVAGELVLDPARHLPGPAHTRHLSTLSQLSSVSSRLSPIASMHSAISTHTAPATHVSASEGDGAATPQTHACCLHCTPDCTHASEDISSSLCDVHTVTTVMSASTSLPQASPAQQPLSITITTLNPAPTASASTTTCTATPASGSASFAAVATLAVPVSADALDAPPSPSSLPPPPPPPPGTNARATTTSTSTLAPVPVSATVSTLTSIATTTTPPTPTSALTAALGATHPLASTLHASPHHTSPHRMSAPAALLPHGHPHAYARVHERAYKHAVEDISDTFVDEHHSTYPHHASQASPALPLSLQLSLDHARTHAPSPRTSPAFAAPFAPSPLPPPPPPPSPPSPPVTAFDGLSPAYPSLSRTPSPLLYDFDDDCDQDHYRDVHQQDDRSIDGYNDSHDHDGVLERDSDPHQEDVSPHADAHVADPCVAGLHREVGAAVGMVSVLGAMPMTSSAPDAPSLAGGVASTAVSFDAFIAEILAADDSSTAATSATVSTAAPAVVEAHAAAGREENGEGTAEARLDMAAGMHAGVDVGAGAGVDDDLAEFVVFRAASPALTIAAVESNGGASTSEWVDPQRAPTTSTTLAAAALDITELDSAALDGSAAAVARAPSDRDGPATANVAEAVAMHAQVAHTALEAPVTATGGVHHDGNDNADAVAAGGDEGSDSDDNPWGSVSDDDEAANSGPSAAAVATPRITTPMSTRALPTIPLATPKRGPSSPLVGGAASPPSASTPAPVSGNTTASAAALATTIANTPAAGPASDTLGGSAPTHTAPVAVAASTHTAPVAVAASADSAPVVSKPAPAAAPVPVHLFVSTAVPPCASVPTAALPAPAPPASTPAPVLAVSIAAAAHTASTAATHPAPRGISPTAASAPSSPSSSTASSSPSTSPRSSPRNLSAGVLPTLTRSSSLPLAPPSPTHSPTHSPTLPTRTRTLALPSSPRSASLSPRAPSSPSSPRTGARTLRATTAATGSPTHGHGQGDGLGITATSPSPPSSPFASRRSSIADPAPNNTDADFPLPSSYLVPFIPSSLLLAVPALAHMHALLAARQPFLLHSSLLQGAPEALAAVATLARKGWRGSYDATLGTLEYATLRDELRCADAMPLSPSTLPPHAFTTDARTVAPFTFAALAPAAPPAKDTRPIVAFSFFRWQLWRLADGDYRRRIIAHLRGSPYPARETGAEAGSIEAQKAGDNNAAADTASVAKAHAAAFASGCAVSAVGQEATTPTSTTSGATATTTAATDIGTTSSSSNSANVATSDDSFPAPHAPVARLSDLLDWRKRIGGSPGERRPLRTAKEHRGVALGAVEMLDEYVHARANSVAEDARAAMQAAYDSELAAARVEIATSILRQRGIDLPHADAAGECGDDDNASMALSLLSSADHALLKDLLSEAETALEPVPPMSALVASVLASAEHIADVDATVRDLMASADGEDVLLAMLEAVAARAEIGGCVDDVGDMATVLELAAQLTPMSTPASAATATANVAVTATNAADFTAADIPRDFHALFALLTSDATPAITDARRALVSALLATVDLLDAVDAAYMAHDTQSQWLAHSYLCVERLHTLTTAIAKHLGVSPPAALPAPLFHCSLVRLYLVAATSALYGDVLPPAPVSSPNAHLRSSSINGDHAATPELLPLHAYSQPPAAFSAPATALPSGVLLLLADLDARTAPSLSQRVVDAAATATHALAETLARLRRSAWVWLGGATAAAEERYAATQVPYTVSGVTLCPAIASVHAVEAASATSSLATPPPSLFSPSATNTPLLATGASPNPQPSSSSIALPSATGLTADAQVLGQSAPPVFAPIQVVLLASHLLTDCDELVYNAGQLFTHLVSDAYRYPTVADVFHKFINRRGPNALAPALTAARADRASKRLKAPAGDAAASVDAILAGVAAIAQPTPAGAVSTVPSASVPASTSAQTAASTLAARRLARRRAIASMVSSSLAMHSAATPAAPSPSSPSSSLLALPPPCPLSAFLTQLHCLTTASLPLLLGPHALSLSHVHKRAQQPPPAALQREATHLMSRAGAALLKLLVEGPYRHKRLHSRNAAAPAPPASLASARTAATHTLTLPSLTSPSTSITVRCTSPYFASSPAFPVLNLTALPQAVERALLTYLFPAASLTEVVEASAYLRGLPHAYYPVFLSDALLPESLSAFVVHAQRNAADAIHGVHERVSSRTYSFLCDYANDARWVYRPYVLRDRKAARAATTPTATIADAADAVSTVDAEPGAHTVATSMTASSPSNNANVDNSAKPLPEDASIHAADTRAATSAVSGGASLTLPPLNVDTTDDTAVQLTTFGSPRRLVPAHLRTRRTPVRTRASFFAEGPTEPFGQLQLSFTEADGDMSFTDDSPAYLPALSVAGSHASTFAGLSLAGTSFALPPLLGAALTEDVVAHVLTTHPAFSHPAVYAYLSLYHLNNTVSDVPDAQYYDDEADDTVKNRFKQYGTLPCPAAEAGARDVGIGGLATGEDEEDTASPAVVPSAPLAVALPRMMPLPIRIQQKLLSTGLLFAPADVIADTLHLPATITNAPATPSAENSLARHADFSDALRAAAGADGSLGMSLSLFDSDAFASLASLDLHQPASSTSMRPRAPSAPATPQTPRSASFSLELPSRPSSLIHSASKLPIMLPSAVSAHIARHRSQRPKYATLANEEGFMMRYGFADGKGRDRSDDFKFAACAPVIVDALITIERAAEDPYDDM